MNISLEIDLKKGKGHTLVIVRDMRDHFPIRLIGVIGETLIGMGANEGIREIGQITIGLKEDVRLVGRVEEIILHIMIGVDEIILHILRGMVEITHHIIIIEIIHQILLEGIEIILEMTIDIIVILLLLTGTIGTMAISQDIIIIILRGGTKTILTMVPRVFKRSIMAQVNKDVVQAMTLGNDIGQ